MSSELYEGGDPINEARRAINRADLEQNRMHQLLRTINNARKNSELSQLPEDFWALLSDTVKELDRRWV